MVKIVLVCTSAHKLKDHPTGLWIEELATPYYLFQEKGYDIVIASPSGGPIPLDENSLGEAFFTDDCKKFMHDAKAVGQLCHSVPLSDIEFSSNVDAMYMTGGHGTCVDFVNNATLKKAIETMQQAGKVVASDCHGVIALVDCFQGDDKTPLVSGKRVTGFADSEEFAVKLDHIVPFLLETKLKEQGGVYEKAESDWAPKVVTDGTLVTGQNPASSQECAKAVVALLS